VGNLGFLNVRDGTLKSAQEVCETLGFVKKPCKRDVIPSRELTYPPKMALLKMIFFFPRWDMLIPWRVCDLCFDQFSHRPV